MVLRDTNPVRYQMLRIIKVATTVYSALFGLSVGGGEGSIFFFFLLKMHFVGMSVGFQFNLENEYVLVLLLCLLIV